MCTVYAVAAAKAAAMLQGWALKLSTNSRLPYSLTVLLGWYLLHTGVCVCMAASWPWVSQLVDEAADSLDWR
jgi:hypothetical protein